MDLLFFPFPPARNALALAASLCLAGGLACEAGGDGIGKGNQPKADKSAAEGIIYLSGVAGPLRAFGAL